LAEQVNTFEEPIREEELPSPIENMVGNRQPKAFPTRDRNGEAKMKNINPVSLPHFQGMDFEDRNTLILEFVVVYRIYDYTSNAKKINYFLLPSRMEPCTSS